MSEAPPGASFDLVATYELVRQRRRAAGRHVYALLVTHGLAAWLQSAADLVPAVAATISSRPPELGVGQPPADEVPAGFAAAMGRILAGVLVDPLAPGGAP